MRFAIILTLAWVVQVSAAWACSYEQPQPFDIQADADDEVAPPAPRAEVERVKRGQEPERNGCSYEGSSCDDIGYVLLNVGSGDPASSEEIGYVLEIDGDAPPISAEPAPIMPFSYEPGQLRLHWLDGEGEGSYDFHIDVYSVDRAGNISEHPTRVHVKSGGASGCSTRPLGAGADWFLSVVLALVLQRARRPR
jgi:hypothetical protein